MWCARLSELVLPWTRVRNGRKSRSAPTTRAKQADKTGQGYAQPWQQGNCRRLLTHNPLAHRHPLVHSHRRRHCPRTLRAAGADLRDGLLAAVDDRGFALERPASDADGARRGGPDGRPLDHVRRQDRPLTGSAGQHSLRSGPAPLATGAAVHLGAAAPGVDGGAKRCRQRWAWAWTGGRRRSRCTFSSSARICASRASSSPQGSACHQRAWPRLWRPAPSQQRRLAAARHACWWCRCCL